MLLYVETLIHRDRSLRMVLICVCSLISPQLSLQAREIIQRWFVVVVAASDDGLFLIMSEHKVSVYGRRVVQSRETNCKFAMPRDQERIIEGIHDISLESSHHFHITPQVDVIGVDKGYLSIENSEFRMECSQRLSSLGFSHFADCIQKQLTAT